MKQKMMIRGALMGVLMILAASCISKQDYKSEYDSHLLIQFEPDQEYQWGDFADQFFNGGKDTVAFYPSISMGPVYFYAKLDDAEAFQGGAAICCGKDADASEGRVPSYFAVYDKNGGNLNSHAYLVFHEAPGSQMPEHFIQVYIPTTESSCAAEQLYVHNVQAVVQAAKYGVGLAGGAFQNGDYLLLTITGMLDTKVTGTVDVKLVDGTKALEEWTKVDISTLGKVNIIDFKLTSSRDDFPLYCCLDDLGLHYIEVYQ
jgi:hypothetical protein